MINRVNANGVYNISNQSNKSFPVFCWCYIDSNPVSLSEQQRWFQSQNVLPTRHAKKPRCPWVEQLPLVNFPYEVYPRCFNSLAGHLQFSHERRWLSSTYSCHWKTWICVKNGIRAGSVFWRNLFMSVVTGLCWLLTPRRILPIRIATMVPLLVDFGRGIADSDNLRHYPKQNSAFSHYLLAEFHNSVLARELLVASKQSHNKRQSRWLEDT